MIGLLIYLALGTACILYTALAGSLEQAFNDMEGLLYERGTVVPYSLIVITMIITTLLLWPATIDISFGEKDNKD